MVTDMIEITMIGITRKTTLGSTKAGVLEDPSTRSGSVSEKLEKPAVFAHHAHVTGLFKPQ